MEKTSTAKRTEIIKQAAILFREKGYTATSMRDLAATVGIEAPSLYNHIKSKEDLLKEICFSVAEGYLRVLQEVETNTSNYEEKVKALLRNHIYMATENQAADCVSHDEWRHLKEPYFSEFVDLRKDYETRFLQLLEQGMLAGEFFRSDPQLVLYTLLSSVRWLHRWYKSSRHLGMEAISTQILSLLTLGIKGQADIKIY